MWVSPQALPFFPIFVILLLPLFIHFTDNFLSNPQLSCFPVDLPNQITHSIENTIPDIFHCHILRHLYQFKKKRGNKEQQYISYL